MFEKKFLTATAERAIKTFVQVLLAIFGTSTAGVLEADLWAATQVALAATLLSVLMSFASAGVKKTGPSLAGETIEEPKIITVEVPVPAPVKKTAAKKAAPAKKTAPKKPTA